MEDQQQHEDCDPPAVAALYLVRFDHRLGNTILWQKHDEHISLEGAIEFKSLPSGFHNVTTDLIYFLHAGCAGVSAFDSDEAPEDQRSASLLAAGVLVHLQGTRLGKVWLHATNLQDIARRMQRDPSATHILDSYWTEHNEHSSRATSNVIDDLDPNKQPSRPVRKRQAASDHEASYSSGSIAMKPTDNTSANPAHSTRDLLLEFGPLLFPLFRAILLRQRVLLIQHPPLRKACEFVYLLSVLTSLPYPLAEAIEDSEGLSQSMALFLVGTHDIPFLQDLAARRVEQLSCEPGIESHTEARRGWIACTSDKLLAYKPDLYDVRVDMPSISGSSVEAAWPSLISSKGKIIKASQRDLRRYKSFTLALERMLEDQTETSMNSNQPDAETAISFSVPRESSIIEPLPWAAVAFESFVWWASAGEPLAESEDETDLDNNLARIASQTTRDDWMHRNRLNARPSSDIRSAEGFGMAVVAYFHQLSCALVAHSLYLDRASQHEESDNAQSHQAIVVTKRDLVKMGLDIWSAQDAQFVQRLLHIYCGKQSSVLDRTIVCCGMRIL
ncbi:MAG: hypothetical protein M1828_002508 [Chrysothrix sp. TS-e1954]|nr:MAG: hypothetical protein M1828_002508 [Chrysothrix sp. TS-e1954]